MWYEDGKWVTETDGESPHAVFDLGRIVHSGTETRAGAKRGRTRRGSGAGTARATSHSTDDIRCHSRSGMSSPLGRNMVSSSQVARR